MRILLVEDDEILGDAIHVGLLQEKYSVQWVKDGLTAERELRTGPFDLLLLDLNLPGRNGLDILKSARGANNPIPVLILTARDTIADRVRGLDLGADDYLVKPFDLDELYARVRALSRRASGGNTPLLHHGDITLDLGAHTVSLRGRSVELSAREFMVLKMLLENAGKVLSRSRLEQGVYGWNTDVGSNAIEVHIHHLRKKLGSNLIQTVRGVGYTVAKLKK